MPIDILSGHNVPFGQTPIYRRVGFNPDAWDFVKYGYRAEQPDPGAYVQGGAGFTNEYPAKNLTLLNNSTEYVYNVGGNLASGLVAVIRAYVHYTPVGGTITGGTVTIAIDAKVDGGAFTNQAVATTTVPAAGTSELMLECNVPSMDIAAAGPWDTFRILFSSPGYSFVQHNEYIHVAMYGKE